MRQVARNAKTVIGGFALAHPANARKGSAPAFASKCRTRSVATLAALACAAASPAVAQIVLRQPAYRPTPNAPAQLWYVLDSKWGFVTRLNLALADRLRGCALSEGDALSATLEIAPNRFGAVSRRALEALAACAPDAKVADSSSVSVADWRRIAPNVALPTPLEKARAIAFRGAGLAADYDDAFWNADAPPSAGESPREIFTWGPAKATVVDGCYIQRIVRQLSSTPSGVSAIQRSFVENRADLDLLMRSGCGAGAPQLTSLHDDPAQRQAFTLAFRALGSMPEGRAAYDQVYFGPDGPWAGRIRGYYAVYATAGRTPTETDFAMFLELARGTPTISAAEIAARAASVRAAGPDPAAARLALIDALSFTNPFARSFARGRLVAYVIDRVGENRLQPVDLAAWVAHGRVKASDVGLQDTAYIPCDLITDLPACGAGGRR